MSNGARARRAVRALAVAGMALALDLGDVRSLLVSRLRPMPA